MDVSPCRSLSFTVLGSVGTKEHVHSHPEKLHAYQSSQFKWCFSSANHLTDLNVTMFHSQRCKSQWLNFVGAPMASQLTNGCCKWKCSCALEGTVALLSNKWDHFLIIWRYVVGVSLHCSKTSRKQNSVPLLFDWLLLEQQHILCNWLSVPILYTILTTLCKDKLVWGLKTVRSWSMCYEMLKKNCHGFPASQEINWKL